MTHHTALHCSSETSEDVASPEDAVLNLSPEDIEAAYMKALAAVTAVEQAVPELANLTPAAAADDPASAAEESAAQTSAADGSAPDGPGAAARPHEAKAPPGDAAHESTLSDDFREPLLQPRQIIEAALFVGGEPLTAKRLAGLLGFDSGVETAQQLIAELNEEYHQQARPYEIRLCEGGYQLLLRPEFVDVRDRVYGRNPKEVTLSQDALEVLALVAYRQPIRCADLEATGKTNAASLLRQLLRRQLVSLQRNPENSADVTYTTTARFLEVFGLRNLDDLPLPDDLAFK